MVDDDIPANVIQFPAVRIDRAPEELSLAFSQEQAQRFHHHLQRLSTAAARLGSLSQGMELMAQHLDSLVSCFTVPGPEPPKPS
ncbi:MAG: hypothetical protein M1358_24685 [Chloroflexi bacterium]|nr:hypothetical protein [Chloroflexota bacterium]